MRDSEFIPETDADASSCHIARILFTFPSSQRLRQVSSSPEKLLIYFIIFPTEMARGGADMFLHCEKLYDWKLNSRIFQFDIFNFIKVHRGELDGIKHLKLIKSNQMVQLSRKSII